LDTVSLGKRNPRVLDIRRAVHDGTLTREGLLAVEGPKLILEAQRSGLEVAALFLRQGADAGGFRIAPAYVLEPAVFRSIQSTETSQGMIALVRPRRFTTREVTQNAGSGPVVVLAGVQNPGNAGTVLRIAEAFGAAGCLALRDTAGLYNPKTVRASAGSLFRLPHVWNLTLEEVTTALRAAGVAMVGTAPRAEQPIADWDWKKPAAVLIGNEGSGLNADQLSCCDAVLRIPQRPPSESLNSAIAAAVILYEAFRTRGSP
jgi:TrmH family RNA methyltransferase